MACENCSRCHVDIFRKRKSELKLSRRLSSLDVVARSRNNRVINLCIECSEYLGKGSNGWRQWQNQWPSFVWKMLVNEDLIAKHGAENLWKILPSSWQRWWVDQYEHAGFVASECGTIFEDVTIGVESLNFHPGDISLAELRDTLDEHLLPVVKCPWGCSDYFHKCSGMRLDVVLRRYLGPELITECDDDSVALVESARDDFMTSTSFLLENKEWKISPSIAFLRNGGPRVLVCSDHTGGDRKSYLHVPRHPFGNLPSKKSDQLAPVVVKPRTVKQVKVGEFSNGYQMNSMQGRFDGVDTMWLSTVHDFTEKSLLAREKDAVILQNRSDSRKMVSDWISSGEVPIHENTIDDSINFQVPEDESNGSTVMTLADSMALHKDLKNGASSSIITIRRQQRPQQVVFRRRWPNCLVRVHPCGSRHGARFHNVPKMICGVGKRDLRILWVVCTLILCIPALYNKATTLVTSTDDWHGFVLNYVAEWMPEKTKSTRGTNHFALRDVSVHRAKAYRLWEKLRSGRRNDQYQNGREITRLFDRFTNTTVTYGLRSLQRLKVDSEVVLVIKDPGERVRVPQKNIRIDGVEYEFRYMVDSSPGQPDNENNWKSNVYARHGGAFDLWQKSKRSPKQGKTTVFENLSELPDRVDWDVCAYCRVSSISVDQVRRDYLSLIGGQDKAQCSTHNVLLVIKPFSSSDQSSVTACNECSGRAHYCCPTSDCNVQLCKKHVLGLNQTTEISAPPNNDDNSKDDDDSSTSSCNFDEWIRQGVGASKKRVEEWYDAHRYCAPCEEVIVDLEQLNEGTNRAPGEGAHITHIPNLFDEISLDSNLTETSEHPDIHTTQSGVLTESITNRGDSIPGCVLLNNCGSLLARPNHKLKPSTGWNNFMQKLVATSKHQVPLVYPEAMIFPSIFFENWLSTGSFAGALPAALLTNNAFLSEHGVASIGSHVRNRIKNPDLLTSTDPRYISYCFDSMANLALRKEDTRVVLNRGFQQRQASCDVKQTSLGTEPLFDADLIDSRKTVNQLSAANREDLATYFATWTCNQKEHFGVKKIKQWLDSQEALDELCKKHNAVLFEHKEELRNSLNQSGLVILLRNWMETADFFMRYIRESYEKPLGKIRKIWYRFEYQDTAGNLPHIHALIWLHRGSEPLSVTMNRIRGSVSSLIMEDELDDLLDEGLVRDSNHLLEIREWARTVLCHKCNARCKKRVGPGSDDLVCRVPNNRVENPNPAIHSVKPIHVQHSKRATELLEECGLLDRDEISGISVPAHQCMQAEKHYPPADAGEGIISPCNGRLFAATLSQQNLQLCTNYVSSRYLAKYVASVDEHNRVYVGAGAVANGLELQSEFLHNTKITGSAINEKKRTEKKVVHKPKGRSLGIMEMTAYILGYPQVCTDLSFKHSSSVPLEERPGFDRVKATPDDDDDDDDDDDGNNAAIQQGPTNGNNAGMVVPAGLSNSNRNASDYVRRTKLKLPEWRQHTATELIILEDVKQSSLTLDSGTIFAGRPPELRFVRNPMLYHRWFVRDAPVEFKKRSDLIDFWTMSLNPILSQSDWVDAFDCRVRLRMTALAEIVEYMKGLEPKDFDCDTFNDAAFTHRRDLFALLQDKECDIETKFRFLIRREIPVVWTTNVRPRNAARFVYHTILMLGKYSNELELVELGSLRECLKQTELIKEYDNASVVALLRRYVSEVLVYLPGGSVQFDNHVVEAFNAYKATILDDAIPINQVPPVLIASMKEKLDDETKKMIAASRQKFVQRLCKSFSDCSNVDLPLSEEIINATKALPMPDSAITMSKSDEQSDESFDEQTITLQACDNAISRYCQGSTTQVKATVICGPPGSGKTFSASIAALRALSKGLNGLATSLMSERSQQLGGRHLHKLILVPVRKSCSVSRLSELAITKLLREPKMIQFIRSLDFLLIDELGLISAEMLAVLDIVFRRVRNSNIFMGGLLIFATMDPFQLNPVNGKPVLLSPHMMTSMTIIKLCQSVRASRDANLRRIQQITRMMPEQLTRQILAELRALVRSSFTFVQRWSDVPSSVLRVFGKRAAVRLATDQLLRKYRTGPLAQGVVRSDSVDLETTTDGMWRNAQQYTTRALDKKVKEPSQLLFFPCAAYDITFNKDGVHSQSQLAYLHPSQMPTQEHVDQFKPLQMMVAPEGWRTIPNPEVSIQHLLSQGWRIASITTSRETSTSIPKMAGLQAKRKQYGLRHRVASTIHSVMGQTLERVATQLSEKKSMYSLWLREQIVVLLSRTRMAKDTIFVGDRDKTANTICRLLLKRSKYGSYSNHVLCSLSHSPNRNRFLDITRHPYRAIDVELPTDSSGYVYLLLSLADDSVTYIGQTSNLMKRLDQHNSGIRNGGAIETDQIHLRPWAIYGFVCGFRKEKQVRLQFEWQWQTTRNASHNANDPESVWSLAAQVADNFKEDDLVLVRCMTVLPDE